MPTSIARPTPAAHRAAMHRPAATPRPPIAFAICGLARRDCSSRPIDRIRSIGRSSQIRLAPAPTDRSDTIDRTAGEAARLSRAKHNEGYATQTFDRPAEVEELHRITFPHYVPSGLSLAAADGRRHKARSIRPVQGLINLLPAPPHRPGETESIGGAPAGDTRQPRRGPRGAPRYASKVTDGVERFANEIGVSLPANGRVPSGEAALTWAQLWHQANKPTPARRSGYES